MTFCDGLIALSGTTLKQSIPRISPNGPMKGIYVYIYIYIYAITLSRHVDRVAKNGIRLFTGGLQNVFRRFGANTRNAMWMNKLDFAHAHLYCTEIILP